MQLGFVSAILPELPLDEVFAFAASSGYQCVELMCWPPGKAERRYAGVTHIDVTALDTQSAAAIRNRSVRSGVAISGLGYYPNPLSPDRDECATVTAHLRKVIEAAALLGIPVVNTFVGRDWTRSLAENWPRFEETWPPLVRLAEESGVRIAIENCPMLFTDDEWPGGKNLARSPAVWRRMFELIPSPSFGLNYDPSHLVWQQMDYLKPLREFASRIFHIHLKDVRLDRHRLDEVGVLATPLEYHVPRIPGLGDIDWARFFSVLEETGYRGPVCVEVEDRAFEDSLEGRKTALLESRRYLTQFV